MERSKEDDVAENTGRSSDDLNIKKKKDDNDEDDVNDNEPKKKVAKLDAATAASVEPNQVDDDSDDEDEMEVLMNENYSEPQFFEKLQSSWAESKDFTDEKLDAKFYGEPFRICVLQNFLTDKKVTGMLVNEMEEDVEWSHNQMDLYEFDQTDDLSKIGTQYLQKFLQLLQTSVKPWLEKLCNMKLSSVSASCSMYNCGDYLLVHDDLLKDRQIAFIYYLSPWEEVDQWTDEMGGCLEIFKTDENFFPHFPVVRKINPRNNQFAFFKVGARSFHQVGEVTTSEYPRMTINGWFLGELNNDTSNVSLRPPSKMLFTSPLPNEIDLEKIVNPTYLKEESKERIKEHVEDNSEISLGEFLQPAVFEKISHELKTSENLVWTIKGPASGQNYEILDLNSATGSVTQLIETFKSAQMFKLLQDCTDLDLAEPNADAPKVSMEMQRWTPGCYTVLGYSAYCEESTLDIMFFLNTSEDVGVIKYLSPEEEVDSENDDSVLLTITPKDNSLNIVYRCEGTEKYTKYVSKMTPIEKGPVYILCCSYKE